MHARARAANHRLALVLSGGRDWTTAAATATVRVLGGPIACPSAIWLTDRNLAGSGPGILPLRAATGLIGRETALLVYDAWSGFDPDGFCAATGTLRGGGLLLLLSPPLPSWPEIADPQAERIAVWPHRVEAVSGRFLRRLTRVLIQDAGTLIVAEGHPLPRPPMALSAPIEPLPPAAALDPAMPATRDQQRAIDALLRLARDRAHRPLVLTAHRGRGKSAALGIAAARLAQTGAMHILVTAPRLAACEALFRHAALVWPDSGPHLGGLDNGEVSIRFLPPDALCEIRPHADLLLVDEAAGIPAPMLETLLVHYPRIAFATTVHGYEGTGRGFELRFRQTLDRRTPDWRALTLEQPIRWSPNDPLESLVFRALLLDAGPAEPPAVQTRTPELTRLDRDALVEDETTLAQVFGLLVLAHYQTRPLDLRMLLDGPNVRVYALRHGDSVVATLLAAEEGGMTDDGLRQAIFEGHRRPRGHLLPQTLSAHAGIADAPVLRYLRVVRIAVHPALTRRGLGRRMLRGLERDAHRDGFDLIGASFGATPSLITFWTACGFRPTQIGTSRNAASGEHALVMLHPISPAGRQLAVRAERRLERRLPILLPGPLRRLDPQVAGALAGALHAAPPGTQPDPEIDSFVSGHRTLEAALPALAELARRRLGPALRAGTINLQDAALLMAAARQLHPVADLVKPFNAAGQDALIQRLRQLAAQIRHPQDA